MSRFNLSEWSLQNRKLVVYAMLVTALIGIWSYRHLGQSEDPPFTFKAMVVRTLWPGASAEDVAQQVTERIEKQLLATGQYEWVRSYSRPGESQIIFKSRDSLKSKDVPEIFYQVRKKVGDIRATLPEGVVGPFFNDEFGTTYGNIYALTGKGFDYAVLKDYAERLELKLQRLPDTGKIELIGLQDEKIWIEVSNTKLATLGVSMEAVRQALEQQNAVVPAGFFETPDERVQMRVSGAFGSVEQIRNFPIRISDRTIRLGDVATIRRGFSDPPSPRMRFMGEDTIGIAVSMKSGGDIIKLGKTLDEAFEELKGTLPAGMELRKVSDQPAAVRESVGEFVRTLAEAIVIVLIVSFLSLGFRTGMVVAISIPLVLAMTFAVMHYFGIGLHKISLGALVLSLGLLVDDAIIAVEMMAIKIEQGFSRVKAASFAYESTAFPMLTGTLVTAAGFLPIATAASTTGEYTRSLFQVVTIALLVSWVAAVIFIPYLGDRMLPDTHNAGHAPSLWNRISKRFAARSGREGTASAGVEPAAVARHDHDPYSSGFHTRLRKLVSWCLLRRWTVIGLTCLAFVLSIVLFRFVPQQFFPHSTRVELLVDLELAEGSSLRATELQVKEIEKLLEKQEGIENYVAYVGSGTPRFYLPIDQQLPQKHFAQFVVRSKDMESRERLRSWIMHEVAPRFTHGQLRVTRLENGPPVGFPLQLRVSGEHIDTVREIARKVEAKVRANPNTLNVNLDWDEPSKTVRLIIDQDRARAMGVSTAQLSHFLSGSLSGLRVSTYREGNELIEMQLRGPEEERARLDQVGSLSVPTAGGKSIPLTQIARVEYGFENGVIWRRNRLPTITIRADVKDGYTPATVNAQILPTLDEIRNELPTGYLLEVGGTVEESVRGQTSIKAGMPLFLLVVVTLLMLQLRSFSRTLLVLLTAPLGLIGVTLFLLVFRVPFGFVAMLGTIALAGMIMRNSVILVDQIECDTRAGSDPWHAIVEATVRRFRPIVLTALAAVLAMIPLTRSAYFGPMAVAIMGGLIVATILTLLFLPALYAAWFKVKPPVAAGSAAS